VLSEFEYRLRSERLQCLECREVLLEPECRLRVTVLRTTVSRVPLGARLSCLRLVQLQGGAPTSALQLLLVLRRVQSWTQRLPSVPTGACPVSEVPPRSLCILLKSRSFLHLQHVRAKASVQICMRFNWKHAMQANKKEGKYSNLFFGFPVQLHSLQHVILH
jgi:hypothetical protein